MVIKTATRTKRPTIPGKRPFGTLYQVAKRSLQYYGYYEDIKQYDPGYHIERFQKRYSYKPGKRLTGYAYQTKGFLRKKKFRSSRGYKFYQKRDLFWRWNKWYTPERELRKGYKYTTIDSLHGRISGMYYQGNLRYT